MRLTPFGKLVRQHRLEEEITLNEMSHRIGVTAAFASAVETGAKKIPSDYPEKVIKALGLSADDSEDIREAAALSANEIKININNKASRSDREVVALFARRFQSLTDEKKSSIRSLLEDNNSE